MFKEMALFLSLFYDGIIDKLNIQDSLKQPKSLITIAADKLKPYIRENPKLLNQFPEELYPRFGLIKLQKPTESVLNEEHKNSTSTKRKSEELEDESFSSDQPSKKRLLTQGKEEKYKKAITNIIEINGNEYLDLNDIEPFSGQTFERLIKNQFLILAVVTVKDGDHYLHNYYGVCEAYLLFSAEQSDYVFGQKELTAPGTSKPIIGKINYFAIVNPLQFEAIFLGNDIDFFSNPEKKDLLLKICKL